MHGARPDDEQSPAADPGTSMSSSSREAVTLSLVLPTFNERDNVEAVVAQVRSVLDARLPAAYELIVVDDDSPDRTWEVAQALAETDPTLRVIRRVDERGLASAVLEGWRVARGRILGVIDADLQHPPSTLVQLLDAIDAGADLAVASRHTSGGGMQDWSLARRLLSRGAQAVGLLILPEVIGRVSDPMSGFFLVRQTAVQGVALQPIGYKILIEVIARARIERIAEVGFVFNVRRLGDSKVSRREYVNYLRHLWRLRRSAPLGWLAIAKRSRYRVS